MNFKVTLAVVGMAVMMFGCGKKEEQTVVTDDGTKVTVNSENGTATMTYGTTALPDDLGVSLYPGASAGQGGTLQVEGEGTDGADSVLSVSVHSADPIEKVAQYYKDEFKNEQPRIFEMAMPTGKMVTITIESGHTVKTVVLSENAQQSGTDIQISRIKE
ncbi:hypothetical protein Pcar_1707 [Syntrophotalea carbinolica DSM 2380]|uniref:Lipoprotein n=1 Tax=Syntrophotalea carbinolica (strain DSM 2380 / NBRC 103641 / GraBd1) TaxID=338963 RepID=Q3A3V7_SYNC1|nr:hypothetical protein [Syntrophotalea carbinolica]ABA88950.1 hypothetical protein Pcar_1707 [Syntrophotalea carbinolica DSM 2380]